MKLVTAILACASGLVLTACEPVPHYKDTHAVAFVGPLPKKQYGTVQVFASTNEITRPYQVIGLLSAEGSAGEEADWLKAMLYRAADMGGDGLLLNTASMGGETLPTDHVNVRMGWAAFIDSGDKRAYRSSVISFQSASLTPTNQ